MTVFQGDITRSVMGTMESTHHSLRDVPHPTPSSSPTPRDYVGFRPIAMLGHTTRGCRRCEEKPQGSQPIQVS